MSGNHLRKNRGTCESCGKDRALSDGRFCPWCLQRRPLSEDQRRELVPMVQDIAERYQMESAKRWLEAVGGIRD